MHHYTPSKPPPTLTSPHREKPKPQTTFATFATTSLPGQGTIITLTSKAPLKPLTVSHSHNPPFSSLTPCSLMYILPHP